jgi:hypothetical protein
MLFCKRKASSSQIVKMTHLLLPFKVRNIEVTYELSLRWHRGKRGSRRIPSKIYIQPARRKEYENLK